MFSVIFCTAINTEVIYKNLHKVSQKVIEYHHHCSLKSCWGIAQSKRHATKGKSSPISCKGGFTLVFLFDMDLVIASKSIQEGKSLTTCYLIQDHICKGQRMMILSGCCIQLSIILA